MKRTRLSLFYLASYLLVGGLGFLAVPQKMLRLFQSNGVYSDAMVRMVGVLLLSIGFIVVQLIRLEAEQLYRTTLFVRVIILVSLISFYSVYGDPLFIVLLAIVGLGFVLTLSSYVSDKKGQIT